MAPLVSKDEAENSKEPLQPNGSNNETQEKEQKHLETEKNGNSGTGSFQKMYQSLGKSLLHHLSTDNKYAATQIGIVQKLM